MADYTGTWTLDPSHSNIGFVVRHAMVTKVRGNFHEFESTITVDGDNSSAKTVIKVDSVDTGIADRDNHLRSGDFFDVETYPEITFESTKVEFNGENEGVLHGNLTIKDTTKAVELPFEIFGTEVDPYGNTRMGFEASTEINRKEFNVNFEAALASGNKLVSDKIKIEIEGSAIKQG